jgi:hypothetical protein
MALGARGQATLGDVVLPSVHGRCTVPHYVFVVALLPAVARDSHAPSGSAQSIAC